jgi:UDP-N-acetylglucosamine--N-acetylmuramyl-(pentapeptide) pyrophosphoryl-undecaprenol N-acetylglucosamine transferase
MASLISAISPDLVVGDEEFSGIATATERGLRNVMISDELQLGFARSWLARKIEARVEIWYQSLQRKVDLLIVPEDGADAANRRYVGPIVRRATKSRADVVSEFSLPREGRMLLLSLSGAGLGDHLVLPVLKAMARLPDDHLVITGNRGKKFAGKRVFDLGVVKENQNLIAAADLVISTAGKSTIDEAASAGTPIIVVPMRNHAEQERNAAALGFKPDDAGRLPELIQDRLGKKVEPRNFDGARKTAELLVSAAS